jgi:2-methylaconitate cis-trans-isomerase PrpF
VFNVNTKSRIDVTVQTPADVSYVARHTTAWPAPAPIRLSFLDAWGAVTGSVFPTGASTGRRHRVTCIDAAMPLRSFALATWG